MQINISNLESHANLNGVNTVDLNSTIKITGSHVFLSEVLISSGLFTTVNTHTLNSVPISDYMMLNDSHLHVNGSFKLSHLTVQNINLRAINTIDPKTFFLSTGNQVVMEQKTFNYLLCDVISAKNFMHNLNITDYAKNVIRIGNMIYKEMIIDGDITILDNLIVKRINGKDLSKLFLASVKKNKIETIKGKKIFYEPVKIKDMSILGYINNFDFNHLFTLKTSQTLPGTFFFTKFSPNSIATNSINGIDFSQDAVLMFGMSVVKRKVHFLQPVIVLDIIVENNGTINALKLSKEIQYLPQKNFTVFTKDFIFKNLIVENSINITDSRIENILLTLKNNVWLKKKFQNVSEGRYRRLLTQNLQVQTVNGISLQDIVLTISDSHINSEKIFLNDVHLSSMASTSREKLINIDDAFVTKNFSFIFKDMHVKGNIDVPVLNNVLMSDLMHTKKLQICKGRTAFDRVQLKSLLSKNLKFSTFKDKNIDNYFLSTLMPQKHILSAKFMNIKAMKLVVTGFLNRKDLNRLYDSVVTLDSNQKILATCMFSSSLNLKVLNVSNLIDLNSVVLRDVSSLIISRKEFIGSFSAENLWLDGKINNVSINDLSMNAFLKNSRNIIQKVITFQSNFSTPSLKVDLNATLDHVMFSELLKVEDPLHADAFQISSVYVKNLTFNGQINQCGSFSELFESALQKNKGQTFLMSKNFNSLNIDGNLFLEKDINGLSAHDINHKLSFLEGENESKNYKFFNVRAIWLRVSNYFNGIDVDFILKDSITKEGTEVSNVLLFLYFIYFYYFIYLNVLHIVL
nr:uncharacterized protein LOC122272421 isoform X1 [Parasteatoda tepidariorum]